MWAPASDDEGHPLATLDGATTSLGVVRAEAGPSSRYGARAFRLLASDGAVLLVGLHHAGPLPSHNWVEVVSTPDLPDDVLVSLFSLLRPLIPPGGHVMVEYDSPVRAETARALALGVPPLATPLGAQLVRAGFAPRFKDWSIAEGGLEGPRKLQCYVPPDAATAAVWRAEAILSLRAFLMDARSQRPGALAARQRASILLPMVGG
jgi:hypothetical protein